MISLTNDRRLIEDFFPVREVGIKSAEEKSIRHGHPSTLHIWWARRPLAASRMTCYAALVASPNESGVQTKRDFIIEFSAWKNTTNERMVEQAKKEILEANNGRPPRVLDPFAGGGSIPLEALRLGCETYSSDLNPVAVLIQKCTLEYPQRYGGRAVSQEGGEMKSSQSNPLLEDVRRWAEWVLEKCRTEIAEFYPHDSKTKKPVGYIWARTIQCQNPSCGISVPLMRQFWLSRRNGRSAALFPIVKKGEVHFRVVGDGYQRIPEDFEPGKGTIQGAIATCPACGGMIDAKTTRRLFMENRADQLMVAVVVDDAHSEGKSYRTATDSDLSAFKHAQRALVLRSRQLAQEWGISPVPDEALPPKETLGFRVQRYGFLEWGSLFNDRQKLSLLIFTQYVRNAYEEMLRDGCEPEYARAVTSYLALMVDRLADKNANLVFYNVHGEKIEHVFGRQALSMVWDYIELNPFTSVGWPNMTEWVERNIEQLSLSSSTPAFVSQSNAASLEFSSEMFDAVLTDPPYYDNVPYSYLSDFFYVWLKRSIGHLYPDLFSTPLTPKSNEIVAYAHGPGGFEEGKKYFEDKLSESFKEIQRVLRPRGIAVIVYAHKSTAGWEALINSLLDSGLVVTGAWPINTEKSGRLRSHESAALASSIYVVARKIKQQETGLYRDIKENLKSHLSRMLEQLWTEGVGGADFFIAAIGSAIEVFGKFKKIIDYDGGLVRADRLLEDVRVIATDYAIQKILRNGFSGEVTPLTRFYVLFRWYYQTAKVEFDEARKLAQSCGIDLAEQWTGSGFVRKEKEFIRVLGPHERKLEHPKEHPEMIDVLHTVLVLWERGRRDEITELLAESGFTQDGAFWRVAQAISETLSTDEKEKKLLDGFLAGRNGYVEREPGQQVTVEGAPTTPLTKKRRGRQPSHSDAEDEHEQVKLE